MASISSSSQTHSNINQHYESSNGLSSYNHSPDSFPLEPIPNTNFYNTLVPNLSSPVLLANFIDFQPYPLPISPSGLLFHSYDSALPIGIPDTSTPSIYLTQTEPYPPLEPVQPFQGFIRGDSPLFSDTRDIYTGPAAYTGPASLRRVIYTLQRQSRNLSDQLSLLSQSLNISSNGPFSGNLATPAHFDPDYQLSGLDSVPNSFTNHETQLPPSSRIQPPDMAPIIATSHNSAIDFNLGYQTSTVDTTASLHTTHQVLSPRSNPESQPLQLSGSPPISSAHQPTGCAEYPLASTSQTRAPAMQLSSSPESTSTPATSSSSEEKRHPCDICSESFRRPYLLDDHKRKHSGDVTKPYHCQLEGCTRAYTSQSNLTRHVRESHRHVGNIYSPLPTSHEQALGEIPEQPPFAGPSTHSTRDRTSTRRSGQETPTSGSFRFRAPETQDSIRRKADGRRRNERSIPSMDVSAEVVDGCEEGGGSPEGESNLASSTGSPAGITPGGQPILNRSTEPGEAAASGTGGVGPVRAVKERRTIRKQATDFVGLFEAERYGRM